MLRLSLDFVAMKELLLAGHVYVKYSFKLIREHHFKSHPPSIVQKGQECKH